MFIKKPGPELDSVLVINRDRWGQFSGDVFPEAFLDCVKLRHYDIEQFVVDLTPSERQTRAILQALNGTGFGIEKLMKPENNATERTRESKESEYASNQQTSTGG